MKIAYFDCIAGISGDMTLGALVDSGVSIDTLNNELKKLNISEFELKCEKVMKKGINSTKVHVIVPKEHKARHLSDIEAIINNSALNNKVKENSLNIFKNLAEAEVKIHGTTIEKIHFHEVGAMDSIIDIIGTCIGLDLLEIDRIYASKIHVGTGFVQCDHGSFPLPAPATSELLKSMTIYSTGIEKELTTPTGAAILKTFSGKSSSMPEMDIKTIGYGAGSRDLDIPNILRLYIGEVSENQATLQKAKIMETNIDDMNPEFFDYVMERLFEEGALDVFFTSIQMKKNRPGTKLSVLFTPDKLNLLMKIIFEETTSLGVRVYDVDKYMVDRETHVVKTKYGNINVKVSKLKGEILNISPEYNDCKKIAAKNKVPVKEIYECAKKELNK